MLFSLSGHLTEEVKFMSDYETFMIMLTFANLIVAILTYAHKKIAVLIFGEINGYFLANYFRWVG